MTDPTQRNQPEPPTLAGSSPVPAFATVATERSLPAGPALGWRQPPEADPSWRLRPWPRRHWRPLLALGLVITAVAAILVMTGPLIRADVDLLTQSNGQITSVNFVSINGQTSFHIYAQEGMSLSDASRLACSVVVPILARDGYRGVQFFILDPYGAVLADESSCSTPGPTTSPNPVSWTP